MIRARITLKFRFGKRACCSGKCLPAGIARFLGEWGEGATFVGFHLDTRDFPAGRRQLCAFGKIAYLHRPLPEVSKIF
jgi:hypothetical protein